METSKVSVPFSILVENESPYDSWKKYALEMVNLIAESTKPSVMKDYNNLLLENRDLFKQYKLAITALDSAISEKDAVQINCEERAKKKSINDCKINNNENVKDLKINENCLVKDENMETFPDSKTIMDNDANTGKENTIVESKIKRSDICKSVKNKVHKVESFKYTSLKLKSPLSLCEDVDIVNNTISPCKQTPSQDVYNLKKELEQAKKNNNHLKEQLRLKVEENDDLRNQVHSLECSLRTFTEAINLQDEQLNEYGSVVTSLKNSRSQIIEKMKDANARNNYNIMIIKNIEREVLQLRRQLDTYNELLINQNIQQMDKASGTEQMLNEDSSHIIVMKNKDNYITLLQSRLCEAIVDLRNKDCEIKNHTNSVKTLINNYEAEKKCLEDRLKSANISAKKLEEHKIKQQETKKQLMKLIEFLQQKLEKIRKK